MSSVHVTLTIPDEVLQAIDNIRGLIPRSTYITKVLVENSKRSDFS